MSSTVLEFIIQAVLLMQKQLTALQAKSLLWHKFNKMALQSWESS